MNTSVFRHMVKNWAQDIFLKKVANAPWYMKAHGLVKGLMNKTPPHYSCYYS